MVLFVENTSQKSLTYRWLLENLFVELKCLMPCHQTEMVKNDEFFIEGFRLLSR
jgi:hypothetical protein